MRQLILHHFFAQPILYPRSYHRLKRRERWLPHTLARLRWFNIIFSLAEVFGSKTRIILFM
jgi:hypothetical protein